MAAAADIDTRALIELRHAYAAAFFSRLPLIFAFMLPDMPARCFSHTLPARC